MSSLELDMLAVARKITGDEAVVFTDALNLVTRKLHRFHRQTQRGVEQDYLHILVADDGRYAAVAQPGKSFAHVLAAGHIADFADIAPASQS